MYSSTSTIVLECVYVFMCIVSSNIKNATAGPMLYVRMLQRGLEYMILSIVCIVYKVFDIV